MPSPAAGPARERGQPSYSEAHAGTQWSSRRDSAPVAAGRPRGPWILALGATALVATLMAAYLLVSRGQDRLDQTFGDRGIVSTAVLTSGYGPIADVGPVALQPDGAIVVAGQVGWDLALARYTPRGSADPTFGGDGLVRTRVEGAGRAWDLAIQPDGMILAVGEVTGLAAGAPRSLVLARYRADGDLDASFGSGGLLTVPGWGGRAAVAVQPDGRIVVAGAGLARLTADGRPDATFGKGGVVEIPGPGSLTAVGLQPDGMIVVAGDVLARYTARGELDAAFGSGGIAEAAGSRGIRALALQPDGMIVGAGDTLARFTADGELDAGFGGGGITAPSSGGFSALALQPDGAIVVGGDGGTGEGRFVLARYTRDGTADAQFGVAGTLTTEIGGRDAGVRSLAVQADGRLVAAGYRWTTGCSIFGCGGAGTTNLLIARYDGS